MNKDYVNETGSFKALARPHTQRTHATYFFLVVYAFTLFCLLVIESCNLYTGCPRKM